MKQRDLYRAHQVAQETARNVGAFLKRQLHVRKDINHQSAYDIKLELDERSQRKIERALRRVFPEISILGEEGVVGDPSADWRWVVDPIDGTVNFSRGLPHACISIALQRRRTDASGHWDEYNTILGVVYDPFLDEMWVARLGQRARLNGRVICVSDTSQLEKSIVSIGFAKSRSTLRRNMPVFMRLYQRVLKVRLLGSAALALTWTAAGRLDIYRENGIHLWDIAAGGLILECAGGEFWRKPLNGRYTYELIASNGLLRKKVQRLV
ncbi:MAG: inositol monophosphatase [Verrucomicrobiales bacterium]|nr:inositol monophosphatase [Verrucomicrobiales bacterium]MBR90583.1 inositol monophosphatase [Verrucomicrobiales bacterium]|tara:strand:+ start:1775 stop:2575 length:801 start_codon:yes stop_codon:yes gene_type:complete